MSYVFRGEIVKGEIKIKEDEIADFKFFTPDEVKELSHKDLVYKPEFTLSSFKDWLKGCSYPLEVIKELDK